MAAVTTYATLVSNIQAVTEDDGVEFAAYIPTAISLAEDKLIRECDFVDLEEKDTGTLSVASGDVLKPSGFKYTHYFYITVGTTRRLLKRKTDDFLLDYWPDSSVLGIPKYYSDDTATTFSVVPTPDVAYTYEIKTTKAPTKLSASNTTNYFVTNIPDALFYASMIEQAKFMKAWSQVQLWEKSYIEARTSWNLEQARRRMDDGHNPQNPEGGQNNIKNTVESTTRS